ncbi:MAG: RHS repeat-associated core domain-containing protein [Muribaculaceae bacterium]|nr:RHS repeat-associated core domain-containing protein [Muribaculaceae bacterium]
MKINTSYDPIGRPAVSGLCHNVFSYRSEPVAPKMTATFDGGSSGVAGSGYAVPKVVSDMLSGAWTSLVSYYDDYSCLSLSGFEQLRTKVASFNATNAKGSLTATRTTVYQGNGGAYSTRSGANAMHAVFGYDKEGRVTSQVETTILTGTTVTTDNTYTRQGRPLSSTISVATPDSTYTLSTATVYDATGAPVRQTAAMKSGLWLPTPIPRQPSSSVTYSYTSLGQPETINYGVGNKVSYDYNLRGQVREIASNGFTQELWYEDGGTHPCYNGNISRMKVDNVTTDYVYDSLNRLTSSTATDGYNTVYEYDHNSSPTKIERYGMTSDGSIGLVDDLKMNYDCNRLVSVGDAANPVILEQSLDFPKSAATLSYDSEGRLYSDSSRDIEKITYAPNDMPMTIFGPYGRIKTQYAYAADGRKLSVAYGNGYTTSITDTRYYVGPIEFVMSSGANSKLALQRVNLPWGFFAADGWDNINLTDYQGNIRAVARSGSVIDHIDYYPYGLPKASAPGSISRYKYSGKEFETRGGLDLYDFNARLQLPTTGLFSRPDPKAWDAPWNNTYLYCSANPINRIDPTGQTDFFDPMTGNRKYINDGINQVLQVNSDEMLEIMDKDFNTDSELYKQIVSQTYRIIKDAFPTIINVLQNKKFIGWDDKSTGKNCFDKAKKQSNSICVGASYRIDTYSENCCDATKGARKISADLFADKSVVVGVRTTEDGIGKNKNKYTCHFIVIVGQGFEIVDGKLVNYFSYFDNATSYVQKGTNLRENRLYEIIGANGETQYVDKTNLNIRVLKNGVPVPPIYKLTETR